MVIAEVVLNQVEPNGHTVCTNVIIKGMHTTDDPYKWACLTKLGSSPGSGHLIYGINSLQALTCGILWLTLRLESKRKLGNLFFTACNEQPLILETFATFNDCQEEPTSPKPDIEVLDLRAGEMELVIRSSRSKREGFVIIGCPYLGIEGWYCDIHYYGFNDERTMTYCAPSSFEALSAGLRGLGFVFAKYKGCLWYQTAKKHIEKLRLEEFFFSGIDKLATPRLRYGKHRVTYAESLLSVFVELWAGTDST